MTTAIHAGHDLRSEVAAYVGLDDASRRREEDPWTEEWTAVADTRIVVRRSRFEVDLNRPRAKAVYRSPADAWGLAVCRERPREDLIERSHALYDAFYVDVAGVIEPLIARWGRVLVLDIHSYNHQRGGPDFPPESSELNPEVNVGTGTMTSRSRWASVINAFVSGLRSFNFGGRSLDVRENVKFFGGHMAQWLHEHYPVSVCVLSVEWKKFYMDEWTGLPFPGTVQRIREALASTLPAVEEALLAA